MAWTKGWKVTATATCPYCGEELRPGRTVHVCEKSGMRYWLYLRIYAKSLAEETDDVPSNP